MKKILSLLAIAVLAAVVSCRKEPVENHDYSISVEPSELLFGANGGEQAVAVTGSGNWRVEDLPDWCTVLPSFGRGSGNVTFNVEPYEGDGGKRQVTIVFHCGLAKAEVNVMQIAEVHGISVAPSELDVDADGGDYKITVTSTDAWTSSTEDSWIAMSSVRGENGAVVTLSFDYNTGSESRSGTVTFSCPGASVDLKVLQHPDNSPNIQFKDDNFRKALLDNNADRNADNQISELEAAMLQKMRVDNSGITCLDEISYFTNLKVMNCTYNQLTSLDVSGLTALEELYCGNNQLTSLDVGGCTALRGLYCSNNQLTSLDVSGLTALENLYCGNNQLTSLDVSRCTLMYRIDCQNNQLTSLDVSGFNELICLDCQENPLKSLNVGGCTSLQALASNYNQLTSLDVSECTELVFLVCGPNLITALDLSKNKQLVYFVLSGWISGLYDLNGCIVFEGQIEYFGGGSPLESLILCKDNNFNEFSWHCLNDYYPNIEITYID